MGLTRPRFEQINSIITTISDPITVLNQGSTLANIDVGFIINRNGGTLANTAIFWNESANTFVTAFTTVSGATDANISISTYANLRVGTLTATFVNTTGNINAGNVTAQYVLGSGQFLTGLPAGYSNVNVTAYTESMGFTNYSNVNIAAYLGGNITVGNIIVPTGAGRFNGPFNESTTIQGVYVGNLNLSPRIGFFNGTAAQNWQIDNNFGTFRWYTPGVVRMTIDTGGNLNVPSGNIMTAGNVTAAYFLGNGSQLTGVRSFSNVFISGQNPVQADSISDTLTLVAGSGITITTNAANDSITFTTVSTLGAFAADADFALVTDIVILSEDLGDLASTNSTTYDLGTLVSASGLIYPDQLVLPGYATASLPSASVDAQLVYDSTAGALKYTTGSAWTTVLDGTGNTIVTGNVTATGGWGGTLSSAGVLGGVPMAFFAERSGTGTAGGIMSHGNGSTNGKGLRMPYAGKLITGTMFGANINGTITIDAYLNGTANTSYRFSQTGALTDVGETKDFSSAPLTFAAGDTLGWYQTAVPTTANAYTVTFFVTYN